MARKWVHEREKEKKQKIWNRLHEKDQVTENMVWRAEKIAPKVEKYPYRPGVQQATPKVENYPYRPGVQQTAPVVVNAVRRLNEQPDYVPRAAMGWSQHKADEANRQSKLRDPGFQKWKLATGTLIEDDADWHPQNDWSSAQNNNFGYLYSTDPQEARSYAVLVNRENRRLREGRTGMPEKPGFLEKAAGFVTDAWNRTAEAQAANSKLAVEQGQKTGEIARSVFDSAGQASAAQADMNRQAGNIAASAISERAKEAAKHWADANAANSEAQMKQAEATGEFAKRTKQHWEAANGAYSEAQTEQARKIGEQANEASRKYGAIWALTSGVTGSDQTGASIYGYRNAGDHTVSQGDYQQSVQKIQAQIEDGGIDALGHAIAARGLSGGKTLDDYNKFLEYSATGKISENHSLTPGTYTEEVDKAIADYLTKQGGAITGEMYSNLTKKFDETMAAAMGPVGVLKNAVDAAGDGLEHALRSGATNQEAVNYGAARAVSSVANSLFFEGEGNGSVKTIGKQLMEEAKSVGGNIAQGMAEQVAQQIILGTNSEYNRLVREYYDGGFSKDQAQRIAMNEMKKQLVKEGVSEAMLDKAFKPIKTKIKRK